MVNSKTKFILKTNNFLLVSLTLFPIFLYISLILLKKENLSFFGKIIGVVSSYFLLIEAVVVAPLLVSFFIPFAIYNEWRSGKPKEWRLTLYVVSWFLLVSLIYLIIF